MTLTKYEKKTFFSFLLLYMGSIFFLILIIASLYNTMRYNYEFDKVVSGMKMKANEISSEIIMKHMKGVPFDKKDYKSDAKCTLDLYNKQEVSLLNSINEPIDFTQESYIKNNMIYLVYKGTYGHLNVYNIVLKDHWFIEKNSLLEKTFFIFFSIFIIMTIIGYFLGKLFLKPILIQREKLDMFIKDTTHELNTPITALLMSINKKNLTQENNIRRINLSAKRISEIYNDLTYLFLDVNHSKVNKIINLRPILEENIEYFKELAIRKKITLNCEIKDFEFKIDKESFTRLSNNIISNAIKYTNINGNIDIILKDKVFIVKDDGIGIVKNKQKDIFDRFYRATKNSGGFGIGLDIVSCVCTNYNIKIDLKSKENIGSTFT